MTKAFLVAALAATVLVSGCASRANSVAPVAVSSADYASMECRAVRNQLNAAREKQNALGHKQDNAALADAAGVFLFLIPVGSIFGGDVSGELAQIKGEVIALERTISQRCGE